MSYEYRGTRFPEFKNLIVSMPRISRRAGIEATLLKNRMLTKRKRFAKLEDVFIEDSDLLPRKRDAVPQTRAIKKNREKMILDKNAYWISKKLL